MDFCAVCCLVKIRKLNSMDEDLEIAKEKEYYRQRRKQQIGAKMADFLAPVVNVTVSKVIDAASEQVNFVVGWKLDLKRFQRILEILQGMLQDADKRNVINTRSDLRPWLLELRAIADEADDVLEEVAYENLRGQLAYRKLKKVRYFLTLSNPLLFRLRMGKQIKSLNRRLAVINANAAQFGLQTRSAVTTIVETRVDPPQTNSFPPPLVVGREEDVSKIESLLISDSTSQQGLPVVAIVGMPGLGKTTLAKTVSKTDQIREKFGENVLWVSVSRDFEPVEILKKMLESAGKSDWANVSTEDTAIKALKAALGMKNYLLILDDVWNEERRKWESLRNCLLGVSKSKGNRVLVTTRSKEVALLMAVAEEHILSPKGLEDHDCWTIIKQRAFGSSSMPPEFSELEEVGVEISKKCRGIPLVASLTGATLQNKREKCDWRSVLKNEVWRSLGSENGILDIIRISYDHLPELALKQCFAFCSIFPKASVMRKEMLIQFWMALGFLQLSGDCSMEDIGDKYYKCLLSCSLFQEERSNRFERVSACKVHDLIHDFAESVSNVETMIFKGDSGSNISSHVRHLNVICGRAMMPTILKDVAPGIQTLISKHNLSNGVQGDLKRLRILCIRYADDVKQLETYFGKSKSLRYLDISGMKIKELPKFVKKLYNLQTFRLMNCRSLKMPPEGICNLINLRHIYFNDEERMPANLGKLINLQTLELFFVGTTKGRKIDELGSLSRLKGKIEIRKIELVKGKSEAKRARMHEKALNELALIWSFPRAEGGCDEDVLEGLQPHSDLQKLLIRCFGGECLSSWMLKSGCGIHFSYLVELRIFDCRKLKSIPVMEGFSSLRLLRVRGCHELIDGAFAYPSLKELEINLCSKFESFSNNGLPSLQKLKFNNCGVVRFVGDTLSTCSCLEDLQFIMCPNLQFVPSLYGLSSLRHLLIRSNKKLVHLPNGISSCTSLKWLTIEKCSKLVSVSEELKELRSLVHLCVTRCPELSNFPMESLCCLDSLKTLRIGGFSNEMLEFPDLVSINNLHASLEELTLFEWKNLKQLPHQIQAFKTLKRLYIFDLHGVEALPEWLGNFSSLVALYIVGCKKLKSFPEQILERLTCLKELGIGNFAEELGEFIGLSSFHNLHGSLKRLDLHGRGKNNIELPHQIQHLTALEELRIYDFGGLEALPDWFGDLPSLQYLTVVRCHNLKHLPSAQVIVRLSELNHFYIRPAWPELKKKIEQVKESL